MNCWTGARLSAFFHRRPPLQGKFAELPDLECTLAFKDIDLVLQRVNTGGWRLIYQVKQRWVKNNRDPKNNQYQLYPIPSLQARVGAVVWCLAAAATIRRGAVRDSKESHPGYFEILSQVSDDLVLACPASE